MHRATYPDLQHVLLHPVPTGNTDVLCCYFPFFLYHLILQTRSCFSPVVAFVSLQLHSDLTSTRALLQPEAPHAAAFSTGRAPVGSAPSAGVVASGSVGLRHLMLSGGWEMFTNSFALNRCSVIWVGLALPSSILSLRQAVVLDFDR